MRIIPAVAATGLTLLASGWAHAIGLGNVTAQSAIGEPLRIEIALIGGGNTELSCIRLSPGKGTDLPWIRQASITFAGTGSTRRIVVSANQPVYDPIVMLGLELNCEGLLRREYPLLLPSNVVSQAFTRQTPRTGSESPARKSATLPKPAEQPNAPSLNKLARQLYPSDRAQRRRFVSAARRAHPDQFPDRGSLDRPIPEENALDLAALRREAERQPRPTRAPTTAAPPRAAKTPKVTEAAPARADEQQELQRSPSIAPTRESVPGDRLTVAGDAPPPELKLSFSLSDPGLVGRTSDDERERMRQEQRLLLALDEKFIAQLEIANKIRDLEQYQRHLASEADRLGISAPPAASPPPASESTEASTSMASPAKADSTKPSEADSMSWWQFLLSIAGFALVAGLLALYLQHRRVAREKAEAEFFESVEADESRSDDDTSSEAASTPDAGATNHHEALAGPQTSMDFAQLDWEPPNSLTPADTVAPLPMAEEELAGEHDSAVELAEIMMSFGRVQGAAQTLADFIRGNPKQAVVPWLKLLEVYKTADMRAEFDGLTRQLNRTFNVKIVEWDDFDMEKASAETIERMPHIVSELERIWGTVECQSYLHKLLRDNRDGTRQGFPLAVIDDILCLLGILSQHLGPYREAALAPGDSRAD